MDDPKGSDETGPDRPGRPGKRVENRIGAGYEATGDDALARRRRDLETALATRRAETRAAEPAAKTGGMSGFAQAIKISSEFIAGIVVGAAIGWLLDYAAGTSPWGLIVFLLLGFCAGVLNVLRSTGQVAEFGRNKSAGEDGGP